MGIYRNFEVRPDNANEPGKPPVLSAGNLPLPPDGGITERDIVDPEMSWGSGLMSTPSEPTNNTEPNISDSESEQPPFVE